MHNRKAVTKVLYHAFVILFGFMMVYPVLWMISGSFKGNAEILRGTLSLIPKELKLTNYATGWKGFGGTTFATFFTNSIFITVIATFGTVISSSLVAYALSRVRFRGRKFWFTCMLVTMMLPTQVIMIPQYLIYYRLGLVPGYVPLILPYFCGQAFFIYQMMQFQVMHVTDSYTSIEVLTGTSVTKLNFTISGNRNTFPQFSVVFVLIKIFHNVRSKYILIFCTEFFKIFNIYIIICQFQCILDINLARTIEYRCGNIESKCLGCKT